MHAEIRKVYIIVVGKQIKVAKITEITGELKKTWVSHKKHANLLKMENLKTFLL